MRYFFFSASFESNGIMRFCNAGTILEYFPSNIELKQIVKNNFPYVYNVVILSICEMTKEAYFNFWDEKPTVITKDENGNDKLERI